MSNEVLPPVALKQHVRKKMCHVYKANCHKPDMRLRSRGY